MKEKIKFIRKYKMNFYFQDGRPIFQLLGGDMEYHKGMVVFKKTINFTKKEKKILDYIFTKYKHSRTICMYPFLVYDDFIWKENIIYARDIRLRYIFSDDIVNSGLYCDMCRLNMNKTYRYIEDICKSCKERIDKEYIDK